jgi:hypothetical protein
MSFNFPCVEEQQQFMQYKGFIKNNNGLFKSTKQANFLMGQMTRLFDRIWTREGFLNNFGVEVAEDQVAFTVTAHTQWASYGTRSIIPLLYIFVLDRAGVVAHYKMGGNGNLRDGWAASKDKLALVWQRAADTVLPEVIETPAEPVRVSEWLGQPGDRVTAELTLIRSRDMGYSRFGPMFLSVFEDSNGNVVNIWKNFELNQGAQIRVTGTVKAADMYQNRKQTTLTRVRVVA